MKFAHMLVSGLLIWAGAAIAAAAAAAASGEREREAPAGEAEASRSAGKFAWAELLTSGVPGELAPFYADVLGWTAETVGEGDYAYVRLSHLGRPVAGIAHRADAEPGVRRARWVAFLSVADVAESVRRVTEAGGRVLAPAATWPGRGEQAVVADAEGVALGLLAMQGEAENEYAAEEGEWMWPLLLTRRPDTALGFYRAALGYDVAPEGRTPLFQADFIFARGVRARAGVMLMPARTGGRAGWLGLVRVGGLEATLAKVRARDGRVLQGPTDDLIGGRVAVVADPRGGVFGLVQTSAPASAAANEGAAAESQSGAAGPEVGATAGAAGLAYAWKDAAFYEAWFDPASVVLPPPILFRGFGPDGKPQPVLTTRPRPAARP